MSDIKVWNALTSPNRESRKISFKHACLLCKECKKEQILLLNSFLAIFTPIFHCQGCHIDYRGTYYTSHFFFFVVKCKREMTLPKCSFLNYISFLFYNCLPTQKNTLIYNSTILLLYARLTLRSSTLAIYLFIGYWIRVCFAIR